MLLLLDFSQIIISAAIEYNSQTKEPISLELLRHISLNNILTYKQKFMPDLKNMIVCFDGRNYWRKNIFPNYKQNRKIDHEKSKFDWDAFFKLFNQIKIEIKNDLPLKSLEIEGCEADDIIAILSKINCPHQDKIIIVSSDKDLIQIQNICPKVSQWSPYHKKMISEKTNEYSLFEHIIRGDTGDGIPNILSDDDVFLDNDKRSKAIRSKTILEWMKHSINEPEKFCPTETILSKFHRNKTLIDLNQIPDDIVLKIKEGFENCSAPKVNAFDYLVKHKLRKILEKGGF